MADARTIAQDAQHARAVQRGEEALHSLDGSPADPLVVRLRQRRDDSYEAARRLASAAAGKPLSLLAEQEFAGLISDGLEAERVLESVRAHTAPAVVRSEPLTYHQRGAHSYFWDLMAVKAQKDSKDEGAEARLRRHDNEMRVELDRRDRLVRATFDQRARDGGWEYRTNPNTTDGTGGYLAPPLWLIDAYAGIPRAASPLANMVPTLELPRGVASVAVPRFSVGSTVGVQTADGGSTFGADFTDASVSSGIATFEGHSDVSQQLLDQVPTPGLDLVLWTEFGLDYRAKLESQLFNGSGINGQLLGLLNVSGISTTTYTDASVTAAEMIGPLGQAVAAVSINRKLLAEAVFLTGQRWAWFASAVDDSHRPWLALGQSEYAEGGMPVGAAGPVGPLVGLPAFATQAIPTNLGAATNQDTIVVTRPSDCLLFERAPSVRAMLEPLSASLQVRMQYHGAAAALMGRWPTATAIVSGTGMIQQTGFGA